MKNEKNLNRATTNLLKYIVFGFIVLASHSGISQTTVKKGNLKVVVNNIKSKSGQIGFFLYNLADAFPSKTEKALISGFVKVAGNTMEYTFTNLAAGTYAVYVFHDEDIDKKLKTNFLGMPKEGVGVSNNAKGHFGPPKYNDAKFDFNKSEQTITITLTYL
jgi:uncharacterized protein (DUF2141 family)